MKYTVCKDRLVTNLPNVVFFQFLLINQNESISNETHKMKLMCNKTVVAFHLCGLIRELGVIYILENTIKTDIFLILCAYDILMTSEEYIFEITSHKKQGISAINDRPQR